MSMNVLLACEESQTVTKEFRARGHKAYSSDLQECSGGHPEWHFKGDVLTILKGGSFKTQSGELVTIDKWDLIIAHPPCTFLTVANTYLKRGCSKYTAQEAVQLVEEAKAFFMAFTNLGVPTCIENPIGIMSTIYRKPDQIVQPWQFGHPESKATCFWLEGLAPLRATKYADFKKYRCKCGNVFDVEAGKYGCCDGPARPLWDNMTKSGQNKLGPSPDRGKIRSKTYKGIAEAMAEQWSQPNFNKKQLHIF